MSRRFEIVIVGGGIAGVSLAYHLVKLGRRDVLLLDKGELTSGSTWHAAGLCTQLNPSYNISKLLMYSVDLYASLEAETGQAVSLHRNGSLRLATSADRVDEMRQRGSMARALGLDFEFVSPAEAQRLFPLLNPEGVLGAAHLPTDGHVDPSSVTQAMAVSARAGGVTIERHTLVTGLDRLPNGEWLVRTAHGDIEAQVVVNAAGQWARELGEMAGVRLPIIPLQHQYVVTAAVPELDGLDAELPVLRDPEHSYYVREEGDGLLVGPFERSPLPWALDGVPFDFDQQLLPGNQDQIESTLVAAAGRVPSLLEAGIQSIINGPDGYTPDGRCLMGEVPGLPGFHVLAGFSIFGIVFGGGAGRYAAEWIVDGQPSDNMWELDVRRFGAYAEPKRWVLARASEVYEREYAIHYPHEELPAGRPLKTSPLHDRLAARGAVHGARFGWERPLWFAPPGVEAVDTVGFRHPAWLEHVAAECRGVREHVGVLDQTSFAKFEVSGDGAAGYLDRLCANTLPQQPGRMSLTQMCTPRGGIECDVTVTMLDRDRFYVVSAAATETHDEAWLLRHAPADGSVVVENVSARMGVLTIAGPRSRELLSRIADADLSNEAFPFFRAMELDVGPVRVRALRVSYVGELGWELHHPIESQRALYEAVRAAGEDLGLVDFGYRALEAMRLEKGYRLWGADISADWTPLEAGFERFVAFDKGEFVGRARLQEQQRAGIELTLTSLRLAGTDVLPHAGDAVTAGDDVVAYVMSGGHGPTVGATIAMAYLPVALASPGTELALDLLGESVPATVVPAALYDPENRRLRS